MPTSHLEPQFQTVRAFDAPALPPLAAVRDRQAELEERSTKLRKTGYTEGHAAGLAAGTAEVEQVIAKHQVAADRLTSAAKALTSATAELAARDQVTLVELEQEVIAIALELATGVIGRELELTTAPVLDALDRAAALLPERGAPSVRVHPEDAATAQEAVAGNIMTWSSQVEVCPDPSVELGGCVVDITPCRIDAQIGPAIERLRAALR